VVVSATKTAVDWAQWVRALVDHPRYAAAECITLVCDNLNTHTLAALYQAFGPAEALRIARKLELVHTPKHGSWLNVAELEFAALRRQCLGRRIGSLAELTAEVGAWQDARNAHEVVIHWQFTTADARTRLRHLYPQIQPQ
jgi:hypothetical protein